MTLSEEILNQAVAAGLCAEHTEQWDTKWSEEDLIRYYKTNPNWCMERHFPSLETMKKHRHPEMGVFVDEAVTMRATDLSYIFLSCRAGIITGAITRLYFGLDSKAKIIVESSGHLVVDIYDNAEVEIELRGKAKCMVFLYGDVRPVITGSKNYKIKDKKK